MACVWGWYVTLAFSFHLYVGSEEPDCQTYSCPNVSSYVKIKLLFINSLRCFIGQQRSPKLPTAPRPCAVVTEVTPFYTGCLGLPSAMLGCPSSSGHHRGRLSLLLQWARVGHLPNNLIFQGLFLGFCSPLVTWILWLRIAVFMTSKSSSMTTL